MPRFRFVDAVHAYKCTDTRAGPFYSGTTMIDVPQAAQAAVLTIGDEVTTGRIVDTNAAWLSAWLSDLGFFVSERRSVVDEITAIAEAMRALAARVPLLLVTGGLGPTQDDLTAAALAEAACKPLARHPEAARQVEQAFARRGVVMPAINYKQADLPLGAVPIANPVGTAPAFRQTLTGCDVFCLPGVPREMRAIVEGPLLDTLRDRAPAAPEVYRLRLLGVSESLAAEKLAPYLDNLSRRGVRCAFRATHPEVEVSFRGPIGSIDAAKREELRALFGSGCYGTGDLALPARVSAALRQKTWTLATAESCTGGWLAKLLTEEAGASAFLVGGVVTYTNLLKTRMLDVPETLLANEGPVSEACARAMAEGARKRLGADLALATTGIAGPDGGTATTPVGLVYIALATPYGTTSEQLSLRGERSHIRLRAAWHALRLLLSQLEANRLDAVQETQQVR